MVVSSNLARAQKTDNSNLDGFELYRRWSKTTKLLLQVIKAIINLIRDDVYLAQLVRAWNCPSRGCRFDSGKNSNKSDNANLHGFELHRPSSKGIKSMFQVIKEIINQEWSRLGLSPDCALRGGHMGVWCLTYLEASGKAPFHRVLLSLVYLWNARDIYSTKQEYPASAVVYGIWKITWNCIRLRRPQSRTAFLQARHFITRLKPCQPEDAWNIVYCC